MAELFHKTFVDAATGANGFDAVSATNGTIAHSAGAGLNGTSGGITCTRSTDSPSLFGRLAQSFVGKTLLRAAWYTDLSSLTIGTNNHDTSLLRLDKTDGTNIHFLLLVKRVSGVLNFQHRLINDSNSPTFNEVVMGIPEWIEVRIERASDAMTADGNSQLYCGGGSYAPTGELVSEITGVLNYTRFEIGRSVLGMFQVFTSTSVGGSIIFDEYIMRDDDTPILFGVSESTFSPILTYLRRRRRD